MFVTTLIVLAVCSLALFNGRSFAAYATYVDLDLANRKTLNQMVKDFRMIRSVTGYSTNRIIMRDFNSNVLEYAYDNSAQTLSRTKDGNTTTLLKACNRLNFVLTTRDLSNGTLNFFPCTNISDCKAITVNWCSSRTYLGVNSDDMPQTATVVMRN